MNKLDNIASEKVKKSIEQDTVFKKKCVESLYFLIDDFGFDKIESSDAGSTSSILFKQISADQLVVICEYERGVLPTIDVYSPAGLLKRFEQEVDSKTYEAHAEIQRVVRGSIASITSYIEELGEVWEKQEGNITSEIEKCLERLADQLRAYLGHKT